MSRKWQYHQNHQKILKAIEEHILEHGTFPLHADIARATGLNRSTVTRHAAQLDAGKFMPELKQLTPNVQIALYKSAINGNAQDRRLFLEYVEGWEGSPTAPPGGDQGNVVHIKIGKVENVSTSESGK